MTNEYLVNSYDLTTVANSIRAKLGTSNELIFPDGFISAIDSINTGGSGVPKFNYTGNYLIAIESETDWMVKLLTSGVLTFDNNVVIDAFLVGGGASGNTGGGNGYNGGGGGSGYTNTIMGVSINASEEYSIVIGSGGEQVSSYGSTGNNGFPTSAFGSSANGGLAGTSYTIGGNGGSGGAAGVSNSGNGGVNGGNGSGTTSYSGKGQGTTTRAFGDETGELYATGGSSGQDAGFVRNGAANTGNGGDGSKQRSDLGIASGIGGSGIVIIRNSRA